PQYTDRENVCAVRNHPHLPAERQCASTGRKTTLAAILATDGGSSTTYDIIVSVPSPRQILPPSDSTWASSFDALPSLGASRGCYCGKSVSTASLADGKQTETLALHLV